MAAIFKWSEAFLTHLPTVDEQHYRLVSLINELAEQVGSVEVIDPQTFATARDALLSYTKFHFGDEESQMEKAQLDPRYLAFHRDQHQTFVDEISNLSEISSLTLEEGGRLVEYLFHWLVFHILDVDQSMARQLSAICAGASPVQAYESDTQTQASSASLLLTALSALYQKLLERNQTLIKLNHELEQRVRDRTVKLENANRQLQFLSTHDELTGLPNRRFANQSLDRLWHEFKRYGDSLSVLILDADHFKQVNDNFGHAEGDALLRALAVRLRDAARQCDIVCRLGGDEFLVICPKTSLSQAANVARRILSARQPSYTVDGVECWDGAVSIGIAEAEDAMIRSDDLLQAADLTLYAAKQKGGACMTGHGDLQYRDSTIIE